jgi:hypothetical protein
MPSPPAPTTVTVEILSLLFVCLFVLVMIQRLARHEHDNGLRGAGV